MDEVTLVNLLNTICEKNTDLSWKLKCKYDDVLQTSIMEVNLFEKDPMKKSGLIVFSMDSGKIIAGKYKGLYPFSNKTHLIDALLEILHYESGKLSITLN